MAISAIFSIRDTLFAYATVVPRGSFANIVFTSMRMTVKAGMMLVIKVETKANISTMNATV
jgi:hypothetical protein